MQTKQINIYEFKELKPEVQEKVLNKFSNEERFESLGEDLKERLEEILNKNKIIIMNNFEILYSLSYCQGDGFCFIGDFKYKKATFQIKHNFQYYHSKSVDIEILSLIKEKGEEVFYSEWNEKQENKADKILKDFEKIYLNICDEMEKIGYTYIENQTSDENIKELIEMNEYTFRENGEIETI